MKLKSLRSTLGTTTIALLIGVGGVTQFAVSAHAETASPTGEKPAERAGGMLDDTLITSKVKAAFVKDETVSALRISVTSNNGIVQLSGFAGSPQEASRAEAVAREIAGVKEVKNDIMVRQAGESGQPMK